MKGLQVNKELVYISLEDNQFGETEEVLESIHKAWQKNNHLGKYNFKYNAIQDKGVEKLTSFMEECNWIFDVQISE